MKKIAVLVVFFASYTHSFSQAPSEPSATVSFTKTPTLSPLRETVLDLCANNETLAESVIFEIQKEKRIKHLQLVSDEAYTALTVEERLTSASVSYIQAIIHRLTAQQ